MPSVRDRPTYAGGSFCGSGPPGWITRPKA